MAITVSPTIKSSCNHREENHAYLLDPKYFDRQQREFDRRRVTAFDAKLREKDKQ